MVISMIRGWIERSAGPTAARLVSALVVTGVVATGVVLGAGRLEDPLGVRLRAPLRVPASDGMTIRKGDPRPAADGSAPLDRGLAAPRFDRALPLPEPTDEELASASEIRGLLRDVARRRRIVGLEALEKAVPRLRRSNPFVLREPWRLAKGRDGFFGRLTKRREVAVGAAFVRADLADIKAAERDHRAYWKRFRGKYAAVYPIRDSYERGIDPVSGASWVTLGVFQRGRVRGVQRLGCDPYRLNVRRLEQVRGGRVSVEYMATGDLHWMAGRDHYVPVSEGGRTVGWLIVTEFGFDIDDCSDAFSHVRDAVGDYLDFAKEEAERRAEAAGGRGLPPSDR